jgi:hypothetical protein
MRKALCDDIYCYSFDDRGIPFYYDHHHLSYKGSEITANYVINNNILDLNLLTQE